MKKILKENYLAAIPKVYFFCLSCGYHRKSFVCLFLTEKKLDVMLLIVHSVFAGCYL